MLFFLVLHDVVVPWPKSNILTEGELLTYDQLQTRFSGDHGMDNVIVHAIEAKTRVEAMKIVEALADQIS